MRWRVDKQLGRSAARAGCSWKPSRRGRSPLAWLLCAVAVCLVLAGCRSQRVVESQSVQLDSLSALRVAKLAFSLSLADTIREFSITGADTVARRVVIRSAAMVGRTNDTTQTAAARVSAAHQRQVVTKSRNLPVDFSKFPIEIVLAIVFILLLALVLRFSEL